MSMENVSNEGCQKMVWKEFGSKELKLLFAKTEDPYSEETMIRTWAMIKALEHLERIDKALEKKPIPI
jgi:hypothetical protein